MTIMSQEDSNKLKISNFKFGIELETNIPEYKIDQLLTLEPNWYFHDEHCGSEIVSPPLIGYQGLLAVRRQLKHLWSKWNKIKFWDCGLHVHVDIQHFTLGHAKRLIKLASRFDQVIFAMMDGSRWSNQYTRRCSYNNKKIEDAKSLLDLQQLQVSNRYSGLNMYAFQKHGTVEFRYAGGTADWQIIYALISLYLRMVAFAYTAWSIPNVEKLKGFVSTISDEYKIIANDVLTRNKEVLFNTLQISGETRAILNSLFEKNKFAFSKISKNNLEPEQKQSIKFSLKNKDKKKNVRNSRSIFSSNTKSR